MNTRDDFDSEEEYQAHLAEVARQEERERREKERYDFYVSQPAIKRLELWHEYTRGLVIGHSFQLLGDALREWAQEEQRKAK